MITAARESGRREALRIVDVDVQIGVVSIMMLLHTVAVDYPTDW
jgi:hypothetical protein